MQLRVAGLPVVLNHPEGGLIDGLDDLRDRIVGVTVSAFVRSDELWANARLFDEDLARRVAAGDVDTSPAVAFAPGDTATISLADGAPLIVEGAPQFIDHVALVVAGVWSKGIFTTENNDDA